MKSWKERERKAAALAYRKGDYAPRVIAKGEGEAAEAIINLARESGVYVHESPELVTMLMQLDLDKHIPPELYVAVAELLAWLYWLEQGMPERGGASAPNG
jgi:flagellar biosynthesis protein